MFTTEVVFQVHVACMLLIARKSFWQRFTGLFTELYSTVSSDGSWTDE